MPLSKEQWDRVSEITTELRAMGCAVCVFAPDDLEEAADQGGTEITIEGADAWMAANRKRLEDAMCTRGNEFITDYIDETPSEA